VIGGHVRWIEIAKQWTEAGNEVHVLTPQTGKHYVKSYTSTLSLVSDSGSSEIKDSCNYAPR
jgi:hypothetical protein